MEEYKSTSLKSNITGKKIIVGFNNRILNKVYPPSFTWHTPIGCDLK